MEHIKPTRFNKVEIGEVRNAEQLLCGKALDSVIGLGLFDSDQFNDVDLIPTNHLLSWCVEVLTAHEFEFFKKTENAYHNYLVDSVKIYFEGEYVYSMTRPYETAFDFRTKMMLFSVKHCLNLVSMKLWVYCWKRKIISLLEWVSTVKVGV